jgi:hypothetical protein
VNRGEYLQLLGEKTALERMIAETPEEDVLDRASLSARLKSIEAARDAAYAAARGVQAAIVEASRGADE